MKRHETHHTQERVWKGEPETGATVPCAQLWKERLCYFLKIGPWSNMKTAGFIDVEVCGVEKTGLAWSQKCNRDI